MRDILFKTEDSVFSYRVAGVLVRDGKLLMQTASDDAGYAIPGGHCAFGETAAETLRREFREEMRADIRVGRLLWLGEIFFTMKGRPCHQVCLYFEVESEDPAQLPSDATFSSAAGIDGRDDGIRFHWVPLGDVPGMPVYPAILPELLASRESGDEVRHFVDKEQSGAPGQKVQKDG